MRKRLTTVAVCTGLAVAGLVAGIELRTEGKAAQAAQPAAPAAGSSVPAVPIDRRAAPARPVPPPTQPR